LKSQTIRRLLILSGLGLCVVCGATTALLFSQPFGGIFESCFYGAVLGAAVALAGAGWALAAARRRWLRPLGALPLLVALGLVALAAVLAVDSRVILWWGMPLQPTTEQWLADLAFLENELPRRAPWLFDRIAPDTFHGEAQRLRAEIPALDDNGVRAGFTKLIALPRDAHSFPNVFSPRLGWHSYPLKIYGFDDGWYVIDSAREHPGLKGLRLVAIGGRPVAEVYETLRDYLAAESEYGWRDRFCNAALVAEWLAAAGIAGKTDACEFLFEGAEGERRTVRLRPVHFVPAFYWSSLGVVENDAPPTVGNDRKDNYVFELDEATGTLLFRFHKVLPQPDGETIEEFTRRLLDFARSHEFERLVIDLRVNDGGDGSLAPALVEALAGEERINRPGRLFAIIGRKTFSAAVMFAELLRDNTGAILVGEPTGQGPVFHSNPAVFRLPESGMEFLVSQRLTAAGPFPQRIDSLQPDVRTGYTYADYAAGRDPAMQAILSYAHTPPERIDLDDRIAERCRGRYRCGPCQTLNVEPAAGGLNAVITDFVPHSMTAVSTQLVPLEDGSFSSGNGAIALRFDLTEEGPAAAVTVTSGERSLWAPRAEAGWVLPMELLAAGRFEEAHAAFLEDAARYARACRHLEGQVNALGYRLLGEERFDESVRVFQLNAELFSDSANTWDSLGEAYMRLGDTDRAIANYEKSLSLNPDNENAKRMLARLRGEGGPG